MESVLTNYKDQFREAPVRVITIRIAIPITLVNRVHNPRIKVVGHFFSMVSIYFAAKPYIT